MVLPTLAVALSVLLFAPVAVQVFAGPTGQTRTDVTAAAQRIFAIYDVEGVENIVITEVEGLTVLGETPEGTVAALGPATTEILMAPKSRFRTAGEWATVLLHELAHIRQKQIVDARAPHGGWARLFAWAELNAVLTTDAPPIHERHGRLVLGALEASASCSVDLANRGDKPYIESGCTWPQRAAAALIDDALWPTGERVQERAAELEAADTVAREASQRLRDRAECVLVGRGMAKIC
ncbi:hypothetical protein D9V28_04890 [Mycetocola zhadangensis]|uniref:Peptidase MA-like domain-containing protein n=2 Tax=Mycetocola zhadangensis TaxID=1164595 RepID=A0A3L7J6N4_9MICO|nr:hypothetical protein D9V28_04890 [Mycetocola zhadangensis]